MEILDVVIGLIFVYLLLSLLATAINEYLTAVMNLRGKELARGLGRLLDDLDEKNALRQALDGVGTKATTAAATLTERFYNHRLIRPLATRQGWIAREGWRFWRRSREPRLPSYIPARTFALALLDVLGIDQKDANIWQAFDDAREIAEKVAVQAGQGLEAARTEARRLGAEAAAAAQAAVQAALTAGTPQAATAAAYARRKAQTAAEIAQAAGSATHAGDVQAMVAAVTGREPLAQVLEILKRESPFDVKEHLSNLEALLAQPGVPAEVRTRFISALTGAQTQLQQLHDSVEVWFNNSMDRVSGAYKRTVQGWLFVIGVLIASCTNADTIDMWRRLAENDRVREGMAARAVASVGALDSVVHRPRASASTDSAAADSTPARSDSTPTPSSPPDTTGPRTPLDSARLNYQTARARLDSMELKLGWTRESLRAVGLVNQARARRDSAARVRLHDARAAADEQRRRAVAARLRTRLATDPANAALRDSVEALRQDSIDAALAAVAVRQIHWRDGMNWKAPFSHPGPFWIKMLGFLLTAIAISLGAPFWFDLLNKVVSIRAAGRAPDEKPKSPEGGPKRTAEEAPK